MKHRQLQQEIITILLAALLLVGCGSPVEMAETSSPVAAETKPLEAMAETKTPLPTMTWLGMQYPPDKWHPETVEDNPIFQGLLTHLALPGCQVMVLTYDPIYVMDPSLTGLNNKPYNERKKLETTTNSLKVNFVVAESDTKNQLIYYEVLSNKAGISYSESFLGYFLFSQSSNVDACRKAFLEILITLQIEQWPGFPVIPGPLG